MNLKSVGKHLLAIVASMAGGAIAGGGIVLALSAAAPHTPTAISHVGEVATASPTDQPSDSPSPSDAPTPPPSDAPSPTPTGAPAPLPPPPTNAPAPAPPPPSPTCPNGRVLLTLSKSARWDGTFTVPAPCTTYTYRWSFGPVPEQCTAWVIAFFPDVNGQGHTYTEGGPTSGGGSELLHGTGTIAGEVNLHDLAGCNAIPWTLQITAG